MMIRDLHDISNVAENTTVVIKCPLGRRYHAIFLEPTVITPDDITEIKVVINGKVTRKISGAHLNLINKFDRNTSYADDGRIALYFDRRGLKQQAHEIESSIDTGPLKDGLVPVTTFQIEVTLGPIVGTPSLKAQAMLSPSVGTGAGSQLFLKHRPAESLNTGITPIRDLPKGGLEYQYINRIFILHNFIRDLSVINATVSIPKREKVDFSGRYIITTSCGISPFRMGEICMVTL